MDDVTPDELKKVAEWCGVPIGGDEDAPVSLVWCPHSRRAEAWQWQAIYEALDEASLYEMYVSNLASVIEQVSSAEGVRKTFHLLSATNLQRYRALRRTLREHGILPDEGEGADGN